MRHKVIANSAQRMGHNHHLLSPSQEKKHTEKENKRRGIVDGIESVTSVPVCVVKMGPLSHSEFQPQLLFDAVAPCLPSCPSIRLLFSCASTQMSTLIRLMGVDGFIIEIVTHLLSYISPVALHVPPGLAVPSLT